MGKQRPDQPEPAAPATPNPFAALASLRGTLPEGTGDETRRGKRTATARSPRSS